MPTIHPTAIVENGAELAENASVGPFCHVGSRAVIGPGTELLSHVVITGRTTLGAANIVWPHTTLGGDPQDLKYHGEDTELVIGDHNEIRENVTIHKGTENDAGLTRVGDHNLIMVGVHVGHDCVIANRCVIANAVQLAGHIHIHDYASIGGATAVHHFVTIGRFAYVGGMTRLTHDVPPFMLIEGNPPRIRKVNTVLLARHQFSDEQVAHLKAAHRLLFRAHDNGDAAGHTRAALAELHGRFAGDDAIDELTTAVENMLNGTYGRWREKQRRDNPFTNPVK